MTRVFDLCEQPRTTTVGGSGVIAAAGYGDGYLLLFEDQIAWLHWPTRHGDVFVKGSFSPSRPQALMDLTGLPQMLATDHGGGLAKLRRLLVPGPWVLGRPTAAEVTVIRPGLDAPVVVPHGGGALLVSTHDDVNPVVVDEYRERILAGERPVVTSLSCPDRPVRWGFVLDGHHALAAYLAVGVPPVILACGPYLPAGDAGFPADWGRVPQPDRSWSKSPVRKRIDRALARQPSVEGLARDLLNKDETCRAGRIVEVTGGHGSVGLFGGPSAHSLRYGPQTVLMVVPGPNFDGRCVIRLAGDARPDAVRGLAARLVESGEVGRLVPDRRTGLVEPPSRPALRALLRSFADGTYEVRCFVAEAVPPVVAVDDFLCLDNVDSRLTLLATADWPPQADRVAAYRSGIAAGERPPVVVLAAGPPVGIRYNAVDYLFDGHCALAAYLAEGVPPLLVLISPFGGEDLSSDQVAALMPVAHRERFADRAVPEWMRQTSISPERYDYARHNRAGVELLRYEFWMEGMLTRLVGWIPDDVVARAWRCLAMGEYEQLDDVLLDGILAAGIVLSDDRRPITSEGLDLKALDVDSIRDRLDDPADPRLAAIPRGQLEIYRPPYEEEDRELRWYRFFVPDQPAPLDGQILQRASAHPAVSRVVRAWRRPCHGATQPATWVYGVQVKPETPRADVHYAITAGRPWPVEVVGSAEVVPSYASGVLRYGQEIWPRQGAPVETQPVCLFDSVSTAEFGDGYLVSYDGVVAWLWWPTVYGEVFVRATNSPTRPRAASDMPGLPRRLADDWPTQQARLCDEQTPFQWNVKPPEPHDVVVIRPSAGRPMLLDRGRTGMSWALICDDEQLDPVTVARYRASIEAGARPVIVVAEYPERTVAGGSANRSSGGQRVAPRWAVVVDGRHALAAYAEAEVTPVLSLCEMVGSIELPQGSQKVSQALTGQPWAEGALRGVEWEPWRGRHQTRRL
ncbi:hypothetical protein IU427_25550 [Nocardia beijingensis]|uniref:hypothetical protein n=1 Tax=Nocardia beijingensis TaxID=95162 RepID=UPI001895BD97|nr:hypothetical protein [Nocardia beijingensis]MBF6468504.1 hypothetical protein [Nocardia beijingensis]